MFWSAAAITCLPRSIGRAIEGVTIAVTIAIVQAGFAQDALNFFAQRFGNVRSVALAARDTAHVRRVDVQLQSNSFEDTPKIGQRLKRVRGSITLVTVHDILIERKQGGPILGQP
jgi:hypothetical protein